jgi:hypothetical protein
LARNYKLVEVAVEVETGAGEGAGGGVELLSPKVINDCCAELVVWPDPVEGMDLPEVARRANLLECEVSMTLILTVANASGVYQSSDYQLTDVATGAPVSDRPASKQLQASFKDFDVQLAFTGIAAIGIGHAQRRTVDWLSDEINFRLGRHSSPSSFSASDGWCPNLDSNLTLPHFHRR